ncbi:MAG: acyltransferase [Acidobacteriota bacterium]
MTSSASSAARAFLRENGAYVSAHKAAQVIAASLRSHFVQRRLHTTGLRLGPGHKLVGLAHTHIGRNLRTGSGFWLEAITCNAGETYSPHLSIGDNCNLSNNVHIGCTHRVTIGSNLLCGSNVLITDHGHGIYRGPAQTAPGISPKHRPLNRDGVILIGSNVWLGDGVLIFAGANIGDGCVVGANSLVRHTLPPRTLCVGSPAKPIRQWSDSAQSWQPYDGQN